ncbi:MAG TPA: hypothetical protein VGB45_06560 [Abditibacterium sp.]|jgi:ABC-type transport system involved in multi-copper enzyme maturation permease subunit
MNPLLSREIQARWRDGRAFGLIFALAAGLSWLFATMYGNQATDASQIAAPARWATLGNALFERMAWMQTLGWLLISPALTSAAIAYERERGWFDGLLLSPLLPRQIALGKWAGALLYGAILYLVTVPFAALTLLLGGVSPAQFWLIFVLHALCAGCGAAVGLAASAWSYRAHVAQRSAYGLITLWLLGSLGAALWAGEGPIPIWLRFGWVGSAPPFWMFLGRTNPVLASLTITSPGADVLWPYAFAALTLGIVFFLGVATYYLQRPLEEAPFLETKPRNQNKTAATHAQIPLFSRLKFANPILDREVRAKFRMRQPPLTVIIAEIILGIMVAYFYARTFYNAIFEPSYRPIIWWGLIFTALIVSMMASAVMGGNGFSRERESGTWEGVRLSLLDRREIVRGKVLASLFTCALFSLPIWPLLMPCIEWGAKFDWNSVRNAVTPLQAVATLVVWVGTVWSYTLVGLWVGRRETKSARASGQALGILGAFNIGAPVVAAIWGDELGIYILGTLHPLVAMGLVMENRSVTEIFQSGLPFFGFQMVFGAWLWLLLLDADLEREKMSKSGN